ncbi:hypothetical protein GQ43DRAFT_189494 [Delitschia confertaspora ATCC 74209]|uniref:Uncharacterized protein n=1 Tax=Delitschia confertaspora ATCC 74209 TaxID=1513339 RepID=A0A9P4JIG4_9PLEO|nr:hypothetical protein GQ43DRAFT_189494 [Delitschia confertaspora ATCC 74209]
MKQQIRPCFAGRWSFPQILVFLSLVVFPGTDNVLLRVFPETDNLFLRAFESVPDVLLLGVFWAKGRF